MPVPTMKKLLKHYKGVRTLRKAGKKLTRGHPGRVTVAGQIQEHRRIIKKGKAARIKKVLKTGRGFK